MRMRSAKPTSTVSGTAREAKGAPLPRYHARIRNAIIDRDVLVPRGAVIGYDEAADRARHTVTERGVVVVTVDEQPRVEPLSEEALALETRVDRS